LLVVSENAAVKGNACGCSESGCVTWRGRFRVYVHLFKCGSDVEVRIAVCDKAVTLVDGYAILRIELGLLVNAWSVTHNGRSRP
jgi:hypothetical protein